MATFDPKNRPAQQDNDGVPGGDYLIVLKNFARKTSAAGNPYLRARYEVIAGPAKGKQFFDSIGLDVSNSGTAFRLSMFAELVGRTEAFDLENDAELREVFCNRPFKARIKRTVQGQYVNNGIERYVPAKDVSQRENEIMAIWSMEWDEKHAHGGGPGGDQGSFDERAPHAADGADGYGGWGSGGGGQADDDIPF
jgi:hypothetical protein